MNVLDNVPSEWYLKLKTAKGFSSRAWNTEKRDLSVTSGSVKLRSGQHI
jgi:hypothetical protein